MRRSRTAVWPRAFLLCASFLFLVSCAGNGLSLLGGGQPDFVDPEYVRTPPPVQLAEPSGRWTSEKGDGGRSAAIDTSTSSKGYVTAVCTAPTEVKFQLEMGNYKYIYDMSNDGAANEFPLAVGNGSYTFTVYINVSGSQYEAFCTETANVSLETEFAPFLVPSNIVDYGAESRVVQLSHEISAHASSDLEVAQQIYYWISQNITYDTELATRIVDGATGYQPNLDNILAGRKGICYDYAALAAAMFRANGIPCKLVMGDVSTETGSVYHAWNYIWLKDVGEIAVKLPTTPEEWQRLDLTFAAAGDSNITEFIGNASNYADIYFH